jgi:hypothetical protein
VGHEVGLGRSASARGAPLQFRAAAWWWAAAAFRRVWVSAAFASLFFSYHHHLVLVLVHTNLCNREHAWLPRDLCSVLQSSHMSSHRSDHNPPGDTGPPLNNLAFGPTVNFITVLELFRAQRDSQVNPQAPPPSPSLEVHYLPDSEPLALGDILSSQVTFVTNQEFEQLRQAVPSQPEGHPPSAMVEAARIALPLPRQRPHQQLHRNYGEYR